MERLPNRWNQNLLQDIGWIFRFALSVSRRHTIVLITIIAIRGLLPAGIALAARGLINATVNVMEAGSQSMAPISPWLFLSLALALIEAVSAAGQSYVRMRLNAEVEMAVLHDIMIHADALPVSYFESLSSQDKLSRAQRIAPQISSFLTNASTVATNLLQLTSLTMVLIVIEPLISVVLVITTLPYLLFQWNLARRRFDIEYTRTTRRRWSNYYVQMVTNHVFVPEIKLLGLAPLFSERFRQLLVAFRDQDREIYRLYFGGVTAYAALATIGLFMVLFRIIRQVLGGTLSIGDVALYSGAIVRLRTSFQTMVQTLSMMREQALYIEELRTFLEMDASTSPSAEAAPMPLSGAIEIGDVSFAYPDSATPTLHNISLNIEAGETIALVGENGAGKTTLAKLIARLYDPSEGVIHYAGTDLQDYPMEAWHERIGFVFQQFNRYEATAAENIAFGDWRLWLPNLEDISDIAQQASVHELIEAMPQGYETMLGRRFGKYKPSDGQWQKLAVARAFARKNSSILILDEPTAHFDARAEYELFHHFKELAQGRTTILISHRFSTVSLADRIIVLDQGRIVESGSHQELLELDGYYAALYAFHDKEMRR